MKILLVSATEKEIAPLLRLMVADSVAKQNPKKYFFRGMEIDLLITGVGMPRTAFFLGKFLKSKEYDFVINLGLCGSFDKKLRIGDVVHVTQDCFADIGSEDGDAFLTVKDLGLFEEDEFPFEQGLLINTNNIKNKILETLPKVSGISVNTSHGKEESIKNLLKRMSPQTESMEGAAFLYACLSENIPCAQIRSISNFVERRNKSNWNIPLAIEKLSKTTIELLNAF